MKNFEYLSGIADVYSANEIKELGIAEGLGKASVNKKSVYEIVNDYFINEINAGKIPWRKTWTDSVVAGSSTQLMNYRSKKPYTGVNPWLLGSMLKPHHCNYFLTQAQIEAKGGTIKKGATKFMVVYFGSAVKTIQEDPTPEKPEGQTLMRIIRFLKEYTVYNLADTDLDWQKKLPPPPTEKERIEACEKVYKLMPKAPPLYHKEQRAYYVPSADYVNMPKYDSFKKPQEYYCTLFHELIHSTGHAKRLKRDMGGTFGNNKYAFEELIAEIGASYICAYTGILFYTRKNSAAYLQSWMKGLVSEAKSNKTFFFEAASKAQKASNFILSKQLAKSKPKKKPMNGLGKAAPASLRQLEPETLQDFIALDLYGTRIAIDSFNRYGDKNFLEGKTGKSIRLHYLAKDGKPLDQVVKSMLDRNPQFWDMDETEVMNAYIEFMKDYPNGAAGYATEKKATKSSDGIKALEEEANYLYSKLKALNFKPTAKQA